ncbi:ATP-grasp domain-containing protein [Paraflavitalea pollutisoli]|uniref:ATP-grasp domain-containing protein n=1 Tax=Paraflavitalea pollutisoli TaxID=3034143 RepID=UPI0023EAF935|nr:ATP-grasp domain-containing protein [Paraflavitalea sp. H1-2-19X]
MNPDFNHLQWVLQRNLTNTNDLHQLQQACEAIGVQHTDIDIIPFSGQLPAFARKPLNLFYGSTTLGELVLADASVHQGFFFDPVTFSMENYFAHWGAQMLNHGAQVTTFSTLMTQEHPHDQLFFIRPDDDSKSFSGEVHSFEEIGQWFNRLQAIENTNLTKDSKIIVSQPYHLRYEWRLWIVNKQVVAASQYRQDFHLKKERGCPAEVIAFAEQRCLEYTPHEFFVMDICATGDSLYIVECGCLNSAGFYAADINQIVSSVTNFVAQELAGTT